MASPQYIQNHHPPTVLPNHPSFYYVSGPCVSALSGEACRKFLATACPSWSFCHLYPFTIPCRFVTFLFHIFGDRHLLQCRPKSLSHRRCIKKPYHLANKICCHNSGGRIRTCDLRVMGPTSYQTALPRDNQFICQ